MKNTDIVFVVPSAIPLLQEESIGTLILAKKLILSGYNVQIVRFWEIEGFKNQYKSFRENLISRILATSAELVSFYCRCTDYHICIDIADGLKLHAPNVLISFGGPQAELVAKETLTYYPFIDYICCSEGENTIVPFMEFIAGGHSALEAKTIPGLTFRNEHGIIIQNELPELLCDNYARNFDYYDIIPESVVKNSYRTSIDVGRGCPFGCSFCSTKTFWKQKFRLRDIKDMVDEIERVVNNYGITTFDFDHDLFTVNKKRVIEFCHEIEKRNLKIKWFCSSRIDTIDTEMIDLMVQSGMVKILFGIETGSPRMQRIINKNLNLQNCSEIVTYCVNRGVKVLASFIYGLPDDTEDDFEQTFRMIVSMRYSGAKIMLWLCGILNGTALYNNYKEKLILQDENIKNRSFFGYQETVNAIVKDHIDIFPQFCDFHNDLRFKLRFFELFYSVWMIAVPKTFHYIANFFVDKKLRFLDLYYKFCRVNSDILSSAKYSDNNIFWGIQSSQIKTAIRKLVDELVTNESSPFTEKEISALNKLLALELKKVQ